MNSLRFSSIHKNKIFWIIFLLLFSLMSVFLPHSIVENSEHHDYESSFNFIINNNKPVANLRKLLKNLKLFVSKQLRMPQILSNGVALATSLLVLFKMQIRRFINVSILHVFLFLCFYFYGSKYKNNMNHSDLLTLRGV